MKLKIGKQYIRRDGIITGKLVPFNQPFMDPYTGFTYDNNGNFDSENQNRMEDLVEELNKEKEMNEKNVFKVGDLVRVKGGQHTGKIVGFSQDIDDRSGVYVKWDGSFWKSLPSCVYLDELELIKEKTVKKKSKAEEYAELVKAAQNKPKSFGQTAWVTDKGELRVDGTISQDKALKLAEWIYDTFGTGIISDTLNNQEEEDELSIVL